MVPRDSSWDNLVNELDEHCHDDEVSAAEWYRCSLDVWECGGRRCEELQKHACDVCDSSF